MQLAKADQQRRPGPARAKSHAKGAVRRNVAATRAAAPALTDASASADSQNENHLPVRTCVACRNEAGRGELLRLVEGPDGQIALDARARIGGRGAWVHPTKACIEMAAKRHAAERSLKVPVRDVSASDLVAGAVGAYRRRIDSLITAAWRCRRIAVGVAASIEMLEKTRVPLVLIAHDAGSERKAVEGDDTGRVVVRVYGSKSELGKLFRRSEVAMIAVTEPKIAAELVSTIDRLAGLED